MFIAAVTYIDSSAVQALKDLHHEYKSRDIQVHCLLETRFSYSSVRRKQKAERNMPEHCTRGADLHNHLYFFFITSMQLAISNPNRDVLLNLSKAGVVELIGKEWYFVRVHDAVQVCLQHVQAIKDAPKATADPSPEERPSLLQRLLRHRGEDLSIPELESGYQNLSTRSGETDPQSEPLLSHKS